MTERSYPKRLIEVDLPIRRISAHARREKSIRHGHISTLHIWWARRPLAACRAVLCAALWPDPADDGCPQAFRDTASLALCDFAERVRTDETLAGLCRESWSRWLRTTPAAMRGDNPACWPDMRYALLDFIADFANWDASTVPAFLQTARVLTQASHEALGGAPGTRPLVVDPFAGGGSIPLEALRVGADAFASDLNPVAVLLNKVVLEYIPKYGQRLADEVRRWGAWIKAQAEAELAEFYPKDPDGATPIAYLWARTITCEGPGCGAEVPLMRSLWLAKKGERSVALRIVVQDGQDEQDEQDGKNPVHPVHPVNTVGFEIIRRQGGKWVSGADPQSTISNPQFDGTVRRGSATCPVCGYTTPVASVRRQLKVQRGGADTARLYCVVTYKPGEIGRFYRLPTEADQEAALKAARRLEQLEVISDGMLSLVPNEEISLTEIRRISVPLYGMTTWGDLFTARQALTLTTLTQLVASSRSRVNPTEESGLTDAVQTVLGLAVSRFSDICNALCMWETTKMQVRHVFTRQAIGMIWDFAEPGIFADAAGNFSVTLDTMLDVLGRLSVVTTSPGEVATASALAHPLPDDAAHALVTDPPYYDAVPYAHLSDFFYVWLKRSLQVVHPALFQSPAAPKEAEIVVDRPHEFSTSTKDIAFYERELTHAFAEGRRVLAPDGVGTIVFASKTTASWEAILQAVVDAGWTITGSWPIDTELENRVAAQGQARLASSVHLVCRPRPDAEAAQFTIGNPQSAVSIGDWRDVLAELPARIQAWMPRLADEGVVGADAIFACLGPALEIFSRYSRVERPSGEQVTLREYLEHVWAAVSREALTMIFEGADATGFEEDARLTAMWLWTLTTSDVRPPAVESGGDEGTDDGDEGEGKAGAANSRYALEYDAARKISQGLGVHIERLPGVAEVKGETARLLTVSERTRYLFGKDEAQTPGSRRAKPQQLSLFAALDEAEQIEGGWGEKSVPKLGATVLDRVHQAMVLFAAGRGEALKRFLVAEGAGDVRFWRLAQALSALYPSGSEEKRWVDGVLARKKGLGF